MHGVNGEGSFNSLWETFLGLLSSYGWIIVSILFGFFLLKDKLLSWRTSLEARNTDEVSQESERHILIEKQCEARLKQQEKLNEASQTHAEKIKIIEADKLKQRIEELEGKVVNGGRRLGSNLNNAKSDDSTSSEAKKPSSSRMRNDNYNPLMGAGGSSGYRPSGQNCSNKRG